MSDGTLSPAAGSAALARTSQGTGVDLRPLTTSELIDRGFTLYRSHFAGFLLLALLCQVAPLLNQVVITALKLNPSQSDVLQTPRAAFTKLGIILVLGMISHVIIFCFEVIISFYIADAYLGKGPSVRESLRKFRSRLTPSLWTSILSMVLIGLTLIFPMTAFAGPYLYALFYPPVKWLPLLLLGLVTFVLFILSMIPVLIVFMRLMVIIPALALENLTGWQAIKRSSTLVRYDPGLGVFYWGEMRLSFLLLPLFIIELLILSLTSLPMVIFQFGETVRHGTGSLIAQPPDSTVIISQILTFLAVSLILPLYPIATTLFYYDIRIRREGFDLEFMARQLGERN
jgi:hypothetical protein